MTLRETIPGDAIQTRALDLAAEQVLWLLDPGSGAQPADLDAGLAPLSAMGAVGLATLFDRFGLTDLTRDVFLLVAAPELGAKAAAAIARHPLALRGRTTPALLVHVLGPSALAALGPGALLQQAALISLEPGPGLSQRAVSLDASVVQFIHGAAQPAEMLAHGLVRLGLAEGDGATLAGALRDARTHPQMPLVQLRTANRLEAERLAAAAFASLGLQGFALDMDATDMAPFQLAACLNRDLVMLEAGVVIGADDAGCALADQIMAPVVLWGPGAPNTRRPVAEVAAPPAPGPLAGGLHMSPAIRQDAQVTFDLGLAPSVWTTAQARAARALDGLAQPIHPQACWDDLVLPEAQTNQLRQLSAFQIHRETVLEKWGFRAKSARGLGLAALFAGPSGTGKTMAAEIVACELGPPGEELGLYRVDLSAIVSKYIGETEKNIARIFDAAENAGVVLVFDEGEALFGKRTTDVKDSLDRHSNTETAYLLQRLEAYTGCAIVTTNLKTTVDEAFLRRFRMVVDFPFPDAALRERIWRVIFPRETPLGELDYPTLARLAVSGGFIRSIALSAAFLAAADASPVAMAHIGRAARQEFGKIGKPLPDAQLRAFQ